MQSLHVFDVFSCFSCLRAIRRLQQYGHLPNDAAIFKNYACVGNFFDVRVEALRALVDFTKGSSVSHYFP